MIFRSIYHSKEFGPVPHGDVVFRQVIMLDQIQGIYFLAEGGTHPKDKHKKQVEEFFHGTLICLALNIANSPNSTWQDQDFGKTAGTSLEIRN